MDLAVRRLTVRGQSKTGSKSYALPLDRGALKVFGIDDNPRGYDLVVKATKDKIIVTKYHGEH